MGMVSTSSLLSEDRAVHYQSSATRSLCSAWVPSTLAVCSHRVEQFTISLHGGVFGFVEFVFSLGFIYSAISLTAGVEFAFSLGSILLPLTHPLTYRTMPYAGVPRVGWGWVLGAGVGVSVRVPPLLVSYRPVPYSAPGLRVGVGSPEVSLGRPLVRPSSVRPRPSDA